MTGQIRAFALVLLTVLAGAVPAAAQPDAKPVGFRAFVAFDATALAASRTFDAVLGTSTFTAPGAGAEVIRIGGGLFVRAAFARTPEHTGTRVVVVGTDSVSLDIPLTVEMRHVEYAAGWRWGDRLGARVVPYAGGGWLRLRYIEHSDFAAEGEDSDEWFNGAVAFGGIDVAVWKWLSAGAEVQYRTIPDAIGSAGASKAFDESDLGGTTIRVMIGIRR